MTDLSRLDREKEFHNTTFAEDKRHVVYKYYAIGKIAHDFYLEFLNANSLQRKTLEYGCGTGSSAFRLAKNGADVTGIDISNVGIEQAKQEAEKEHLAIDFHVMDAENLNFPDSTFDLACGTAILHHLDLAKALSELNRVLKPDGYAVFYEPLSHNPIIQLYRRLTPQLRTPDEHPLTVTDIATIGNQFDVVEMRYFCFTSLFAIPLLKLPIFPVVLSALNRVDAFLFSTIPFLRRYAWIVVFVLKKRS